MDVLFDKSLIGSQKHLLFSSDGFSRHEKTIDGAWHLSGHIKPTSTFCFDTVLLLNSAGQIPKVPDQYRRCMEKLAPDLLSPPWSMIIPPEIYRNYIDDLVNYAKKNLNIDVGYYKTAWIPGSHVLNSLKPAKVDGARITEIINSGAHNSHIAETFKPRSGGYAQPVLYNRFSTVTGRLTVESGPNILLLKKEYRDVIKPSDPNGKILSLDFSSLEARILLYESGNDCVEQDLYSTLANRFGGMPRDLVKAAVLSVLYGSSKSMVALNLGVTESKVNDIVLKIEEYIDTRSLLKRLKSQLSSTGHITNKFGRKIKIERPQDNILVNYYAQSTGVDVSLMGFSKIIETLGGEGIRPIFVLHDALILDVHGDRVNDVLNVSKTTVPGYTQTFPIKVDEITR